MVKCADCGFLALRDKTTGLLKEVIDDYRVSGRVPEYIKAYRGYHNYPICFAMAYDLIPEVEDEVLKQMIDKSDDWEKYVPYIPFFLSNYILESLTLKEFEIYEALLRNNHKQREIAETLDVTEAYVSRVKDKLHKIKLL